VERKAERTWEIPSRERSSRPGTLTLEWSPRKRESLQARERPLRATGPVKEQAAARLEALIRRPEKTACGEQKGESVRHSGMRRSVPGMLAESEAANPVTWNHFLFGGAAFACAPPHSSRSVTTGSTSAARSAGRVHAARAVIASTTVTITNVAASLGFTS